MTSLPAGWRFFLSGGGTAFQHGRMRAGESQKGQGNRTGM